MLAAVSDIYNPPPVFTPLRRVFFRLEIAMEINDKTLAVAALSSVIDVVHQLADAFNGVAVDSTDNIKIFSGEVISALRKWQGTML